jgi:transcription factor-like protein
MAFAMSLHCEIPAHSVLSLAAQHHRRCLFWTCYILDRFLTSGSRRPSLISDDYIEVEPPRIHDVTDSIKEGTRSFGASLSQPVRGVLQVLKPYGYLIEITRILGLVDKYLVAGGPKSDANYPWHEHSTLSKIRHQLERWAMVAQAVFQSLDVVLGRLESVIYPLSRLVYHLVYCLIYRSFMPIDLHEISTSGQNQSWRMEAMNLCFFHANSIAELVDTWKTGVSQDIPAFAAYCLAVAGTIHIHGYYHHRESSKAFSTNKAFLNLEFRRLEEMEMVWEGVQNQLKHLYGIYKAHSVVIRSTSERLDPRYSYGSFFDRYDGLIPDGAFLSLELDDSEFR